MMLAVLIGLGSLTLSAQNTLTVADGTATNSNVPIHGLWADAYLRCQTVYTAASLDAAAVDYGMNGGTITSLTYYLSSPAAEAWTGTWEVKLMEVTTNTLSGFVDMTNATTVFTGTLDGSSTPLVITFTTPYTYQGGNLIIEVSEITTGIWKSASFYGETVNDASWQGYNSSAWSSVTGSGHHFIPKTTFTFTGGSEITCSPVLSLSIDATQTTSNSLTLSWIDTLNAGATFTIYNMADNTVVESGITGTTHTITDLAANTEYTFGVQAMCTSSEAPITTVSGRTACDVNELPFTESFDVSLSNDPCWRGASILASDVFSGTPLTQGNITGWSYQSSESNGLPAGHYRANIYGSNCKYWLITPTIDLGTVTSPLLSFDAAFTKYSGTAIADGDLADDKFMVVISTDGGQTWDSTNAISFNLSSLASLTYLTQYVSLSNYVGDTVKIAFYAESTVSGGDNNLHIDNISVIESTGDLCLPVNTLTANNVTSTEATLTWNGDADSYNIYVVSDNDTTLMQTVTSATIDLTGLTAMTSYTYGVCVPFVPAVKVQ